MATDHHRNADTETDVESKTGSADAQTYVFSPEKAASFAVLEAVGSASETDPTALPPLYGAIDPDALDTLFESSDPASAARVSFSYAGYEVAVDGGPTLTVDLESSD